MGTDPLQALRIVTRLAVDTVDEDRAVLAIEDITLPIEEPGGDLVLCRVPVDGDNALKLFGCEFTSSAREIRDVEQRLLQQMCAYRLFQSTSAFLYTKLE